MKQLIVILLFILPQCGFGQNNAPSEQSHKTFFSVGLGVLPLDDGYKRLESSDGQPNVTLLKKPYPISLKLEYFISEYVSLGLNLNHYRYRVEWTANYAYGGSPVAKYNFIHQNGRTALIGRINIGRTKLNYSWYIGLGGGWRLIDHYDEKVSPYLISWGRDSNGFPIGVELSGG